MGDSLGPVMTIETMFDDVIAGTSRQTATFVKLFADLERIGSGAMPWLCDVMRGRGSLACMVRHPLDVVADGE